MNNQSEFICVAEAAELLRLSCRTVQRRIVAGHYQTVYKLPGATGSYLLAKDEIEALAVAA